MGSQRTGGGLSSSQTSRAVKVYSKNKGSNSERVSGGRARAVSAFERNKKKKGDEEESSTKAVSDSSRGKSK
jgi:hypothetical protein